MDGHVGSESGEKYSAGRGKGAWSRQEMATTSEHDHARRRVEDRWGEEREAEFARDKIVIIYRYSGLGN